MNKRHFLFFVSGIMISSVFVLVTSFLPKFSFASGGAGVSSSVVTISDFSLTSSKSGSEIDFSARAHSTSTISGFVYSLGCATSSTGTPTFISNSSVDVVINTKITGLVDSITPRVSQTNSYWCELLNAGTVLSGAGMTQVTPPTTMGRPYIIPSSLDTSSAKIEIDFTSTSAPASAPQVIYSTNSSPTSGGSIANMSNSGSPNKYIVSLSGLASSTTYYYTVRDSTDQTFVYGDVGQSFTTRTPTSYGFDANGNPIFSPPAAYRPDTIKYVGNTTIRNSNMETNVNGYGLVGCEGGWKVTNSSDPNADSQGVQLCGFPELIALINRLIKYVVVFIAPVIFTCTLAYGGWLYLTSPAVAENKEQAKSIIMDALIGWLLAAAAWLIIKFVMTSLGYDSTKFPTFW